MRGFLQAAPVAIAAVWCVVFVFPVAGALVDGFIAGGVL